VTVVANVNIGQRAFFGIGATVANGVTIGDDSFVGAGVLVTHDVEPRSVHIAGEQGKLSADSRAFMRVMMAQHRL
jgi:carbonic anhydrase/acetyltransferase-like protein (isoleucine patch superfamily)